MKTTGLNFLEAVQAASEGHRVRRAVWREKSYVYSVNSHLRYTDGEVDASLETFIKNLLATDWEIVHKPPKTMTFMKALERIEAGKKVRRLAWGTDLHGTDLHARLYKDKPNVGIFGDSVIANTFTAEDYKATDWIEVEGEEQ